MCKCNKKCKCSPISIPKGEKGDNGVSGLVEITYSALAALKTAGTLIPGVFYKITDRGDQGIVIQALSTTLLDFYGTRIMNCPKDYRDNLVSGINWRGVWRSTNTYVASDASIWGGKVWLNNAGVVGSSIDIATLSNNWTVVPKPSYSVTSNYYITKEFKVSYDFDNDFITEQYDENNNVIGMPLSLYAGINYVDITDWNLTSSGASGMFKDNKSYGIYNNIANVITNNNVGNTIDGNTKSNSIQNNKVTGKIGSNAVTVAISNNTVVGDIVSVNCNTVVRNIVNGSISGTITGDISDNIWNTALSLASPIYHMKSNFAYSGNASNFFEIASASAINLTTQSAYIRRFTITNSGTTNITSFVNFPSVIGSEIIFNPVSGLVITFVHGVGATAPKCVGATDKIINGSNADFIEFEYASSIAIRQSNIGTY